MTNMILALLFIFLPPCATEDSTYCSWNGATQGNGAGSSFITLEEGQTLYLD